MAAHMSNGRSIENTPVMAKDFCQASQQFCHSYNLGDKSSAYSQLFEGQLSVGSLHNGVSFSTAHLHATKSSKHSIVLPKSVCLVFAIDGESSEIDPLGNGARQLRRGETAVFQFSDCIESESRYFAGQTSKSVLIQLCEDSLLNEQLYEFTARKTRESSISVLPMCSRILGLGASFFGMHSCDTVQSLLREARLLEMIACAIGQDAPVRERCHHSDHVRLERVLDLIENQPEEEHSLASLAAAAGMSVSSLKSKFADRFGSSVIGYLRDVRLERARDGLYYQGWTVKQAAGYAGYRHAANFTTAFRKRFGKPPKSLIH